MTIKVLKFSGMLLAVLVFHNANARLSLEIAGQKVTSDSGGEVTAFKYHPGSSAQDSRVEIGTFFADIRCAGLEPFTAPAFSLELDQIIMGAEPEAKYDLAGAESITYHPDTGVIAINYPQGSAVSSDCTHKIPAVGFIEEQNGKANPGAFWISDFGPVLEVTFEVPDHIVGFRIRVRNKSPIIPQRDIKVNFTAPEGSQFSSLESVVDNSGGSFTWTIPLLWPVDDQSAEDEAFLDVSTADLGTGVGVGSLTSLPRSSYPEPAPVITTVVNTSTSR